MLPREWTCPPLSKEGQSASASLLALRRRVSAGACWFSLLYRMPHALHSLPDETSCERTLLARGPALGNLKDCVRGGSCGSHAPLARKVGTAMIA
jgi:hypothetical protein